MVGYAKYLLWLFLFLLLGYAGHNLYVYFFDTNNPELSLIGIQQDDWFSGEMRIKIHGRDTYKIAHVSAWIDGKAYLDKETVNAVQCERELVINTTELAEGKHLLRCAVVDGTRSANRSETETAFFVDNTDLQAALVTMNTQKVLQGRCLRLKIRTNKTLKHARVKTMSQEFVCFPEYSNSTLYEAFIPVACEQEPGDFAFTVEGQDFVGNTFALAGDFSVVKAPFKNKVINVKAGRLKDESQFTDLTERDLEDKMAEIARCSPSEKLWKGLFEVPLHMTGISTEFGLIRTSQERGKYAHKAIDLVGMPRSVVWASNDGTVVIKDRYVHTGNTVVIDHGYGIVTLYCHFEEYADVHVGQKIKKGKPLGTMGMTGYANGYHLHWELRVNNVMVDPMEWTK
jgi:hypothetical protein